MTDREYLIKLKEHLEDFLDYEEISWAIDSFISHQDEDMPAMEALDIGGIIKEDGSAEIEVTYDSREGHLYYRKFGQEWQEI